MVVCCCKTAGLAVVGVQVERNKEKNREEGWGGDGKCADEEKWLLMEEEEEEETKLTETRSSRVERSRVRCGAE